MLTSIFVKKTFVLMTAFLVLSASAFAQTGVSETQAPVANQPSFGGAKDAAAKSKDKQSMAQLASIAVAAVMMAMCPQPNPAACAAAALAAAQAGSLAGTSAGAGKSADAYSGGFGGSAGGGTSGSGTGANASAPDRGVQSGGGGKVADRAKQILDGLASQGYNVNDKGEVTMPDGSKVSGKDFGSDAAMSAAGFTAQQIADFRKAQEMARAENKTKLAGISADGGGGGAGDRAPADEKSGKGFDFDAFMRGKQKKEDKGKLAGMSTNYGNDKIGVAADDIFKMITRRYQARDAANDFLKK